MSSKSRLFTLHWDNSKIRIQPTERYKQREVEGIHWRNGLISLMNGAVYANMDEMEHTLGTAGKFRVVYDDESEAENTEQNAS